MSKIAFHTGMVSYQLYNLLAKTLCQLIVIKDEGGSISWILIFDQEPLKGNLKNVEIDESSGIYFKMQARLGEDFMVTVPITGEKAKVNTVITTRKTFT